MLAGLRHRLVRAQAIERLSPALALPLAGFDTVAVAGGNETPEFRRQNLLLAAAWGAVHDATPDGWYVGRPYFDERQNRWQQYAFDQAETPVVGKRSREWTAVGRTELECVQVMARCLADHAARVLRPLQRRRQPRRRDGVTRRAPASRV